MSRILIVCATLLDRIGAVTPLNIATLMQQLEYFCDNPRCYLHVTLMPGHNWAELADGRIFSRGMRDGRNLCDICMANEAQPVNYPEAGGIVDESDDIAGSSSDN